MKKINSIKQNFRFQRLYKKGESFVTPCFVCYIRKQTREEVSLGITVSKKIGGAVDRNRAKRVLRQAVREAAGLGLSGCEILLVARGKTPFVKSTRVSKELCEILIRAGYIKTEINA